MQESKVDELQVFRATIDDRDAAYEIVQEYCDAVDVVVRDDETEFDKYFHDNGGVWLARLEGKIVGCIALRPLPQLKDACEVKRLYVKPECRGRRIADRLLQLLHDYALGFGYEWCYLDTKDDLKAAIKFYAQQGYEICDRYNDNPQATIFMRKKLTL